MFFAEFSSLLHYAAQHGHEDLTQFLIESGGEDVNVTNGLGETPLHLASGAHVKGTYLKQGFWRRNLSFVLEFRKANQGSGDTLGPRGEHQR